MFFWLWPWFWFAAGRTTTIRPALPGDCARIAELHASGFAIGWEPIEIERMLVDHRHVADVLVSATLIGEVVTGFAISRVVLDESELLSVALDPELRGRGLAATLLTSHAGRLRQAGATSLFLEVAADNLPALALYRRLGFAETGRRKGYYPGPNTARNARRDALTMRWSLEGFDPTPRFG